MSPFGTTREWLSVSDLPLDLVPSDSVFGCAQKVSPMVTDGLATGRTAVVFHSDRVGGRRENGRMIDWPNLLAGFLLGLVPTLLLWWNDHRQSQRARTEDARVAWMGAARDIELGARPESTAGDIFLLRTKYPIDRWRSILGPDDFRALERLESAYQQVEFRVEQAEKAGRTPESIARIDAALLERRDAYVEFANLSRRMQSASYHEVVTAEERARTRRDYLRHPIRTWRRERRNRLARRNAGIEPPRPRRRSGAE